MSSPTPAAPNEADTSRGWIDLVLICLGGLLMVAGWFVAGAAAAGFGLVMPAVRWFGAAMMMTLTKEEAVLLTYTGAGAVANDFMGGVSVFDGLPGLSGYAGAAGGMGR